MKPPMFVSAASSAPSAARVTTHGMIVWNGLHRAARGENATRTVAFRDRRGRSRRRVAKRLSRDEGRSPAPPLLLRLLRARGRVRQLGRDGDATSALLRPLRSFNPGGARDDTRAGRATTTTRDVHAPLRRREIVWMRAVAEAEVVAAVLRTIARSLSSTLWRGPRSTTMLHVYLRGRGRHERKRKEPKQKRKKDTKKTRDDAPAA